MAALTHKCPAPPCATRVPFGIFACSVHGRMLPQHLRTAVSTAWARSAWAEHADARKAAVEWWKTHT